MDHLQLFAPSSGQMRRYFGRDITNFETQQPVSKDIQPSRSGLKIATRDLSKPALGPSKPSPVQFYKDLFQNQRNLHKKASTNDLGRSQSVENKDTLNKIKPRVIPIPEVTSKPETVKNAVNRLHGNIICGLKKRSQMGEDLLRQLPLRESKSREKGIDSLKTTNAGSNRENQNSKIKSGVRLNVGVKTADEPLGRLNNPASQALKNSRVNLQIETQEIGGKTAAEVTKEREREMPAKSSQEPAVFPTNTQEVRREMGGIDTKTIWSWLLSRDANRCTGYYFERHQGLNEGMRGILIDWLVDVHRKFKLRHETLFLAVSYIDRYLQKGPHVTKGRLQLLGVSSLFAAGKYEEIYPPSLGEYVAVCADTYSGEEVLSMEANILQTLEFSLVSSSPLQILGLYLHSHTLAAPLPHLLLYLLFLSLLHYQLVSVSPAILVSAAIFLGHKLLNQPIDLDYLSSHFTVPTSQIKATALELFLFLSQQENEDKLTAVKRMFNHSQFGYVSSIKLTVKTI